MKIFSLANKLILFFLLFSMLALAVVATYAFVETGEILENQIDKDLVAIAEGTGGQVLIFFEKIKMQSADWSSDWFIRQQIEELVKTGNQDFAEAFRKHLLKNKLSLDPLVVVADILNTDMKVIVSSDEKRVGIDELEHAESKSKEELMALKYGETMISQVTVEQASEIHGGIHPEYPVFHSLVPIKSIDNEATVGFLLLHFSADNLNKIVGGSFQIELGALSGQEFILSQKTAEMFLVNSDGFMITPSRFLEDTVLNKKIDNPATQACFDDKKEYSGGYVGYLGRNVQVASMCLVDYNIVLLAEIGTDEVFAPLIKGRDNIVLLGFGIWLVGIMTIYFFSKVFLKNIIIIGDVAKDVSRGNLNARVKIKAKDETGELAKVFNQMLDIIKKSENDVSEASKKLQGANQEIEKEKISLMTKVRERTEELENIKNSLELTVREKTVELEKRVKDLEKFKKLVVGRELRMIELKDEVDMLKKNLENKK